MQNKLVNPQHKDWLAIKCLAVLLKPLATASKWLGGQIYPTLPLVMPAIDALEDVLNDHYLFDDVLNVAGNETYVDGTRVIMKDCHAVIKRLFASRFSILKSKNLIWIAYLDPRVASAMNHFNLEEEPGAQASLIKAAVELHEYPFPSLTTSYTPGKTKKNYLIASPRVCLERKNAPQHRCKKAVHDAFEAYLTMAKSLMTGDDESDDEDDSNPFDWWRVNKVAYPHLSKLARKWLGAEATSVPSERAFSIDGNIITTKRSSLTRDLIRDLVLITENTNRKQPLPRRKKQNEFAHPTTPVLE
ncbi:hypothetical protein JG687_00018738 [Phytophthora cactorum]|uniref:HAT C-terminal dimerisation domain-containing protein n=1 Tax=Phytophthora cactorum TaxID=29920 RepID=A0A8T1TKC1_9STRA|nr:hypothetical protein JG687_00018738 [Phytophthora cactorum]